MVLALAGNADMIRKTTPAAAALLLAVSAAPLVARYTPPSMPAGYNDAGPEPTNLLPLVVRRLKVQLYDPSSAQDLIICRPLAMEATAPTWKGGEWQPARWLVAIALNSKNRFGGYIGQTDGSAYIRNNKVLELRFKERKPPVTNYEELLAKFSEKMLESCDHVSNSELQRALESAR